ncbi:MAG: tetratricopeptide repeat protein [Pyrinomonadaceae bacterium]
MRAHFLRAILVAAFLSVFSAYGQVKKPVGAQFREIVIVTQPKAIVWIDGVRFGRTGADGRMVVKTISSGPHTLRLRADGFKDKTQTITAAQKGEVSVTLITTTDEAELAYQEAERLIGADREKAAAEYRRAIAARPTYADAYLGLARVTSEAGDLDAAEKAIAALRKLKPGHAEASAIEGRIHKDNGDEAKAIASFKRAITEGKGYQPEAYTGLGLLYKDKAEGLAGSGDTETESAHYAEAAKNLKIALKQLSGAPDAVVIYQLLGLTYERQKKYPEAIAIYEEFLRLFPETPEATSVRSFIVQLKKDMNER